MARALLVIVVAAIGLCGCATTFEETIPQPEPLAPIVRKTRVGFGNTCSRDGLKIEPAGAVVEAGKELAGTALQMAGPAAVPGALDIVTSAAVSR